MRGGGGHPAFAYKGVSKNFGFLEISAENSIFNEVSSTLISVTLIFNSAVT
jgi:hypothetical protein